MSKIDSVRVQNSRARPETEIAPRRADRPKSAAHEPFWVLNAHLGAIEVENRQRPRPERPRAPRNAPFAAQNQRRRPLLTTLRA
jgi:hypothetical protein